MEHPVINYILNYRTCRRSFSMLQEPDWSRARAGETRLEHALYASNYTYYMTICAYRCSGWHANHIQGHDLSLICSFMFWARLRVRIFERLMEKRMAGLHRPHCWSNVVCQPSRWKRSQSKQRERWMSGCWLFASGFFSMFLLCHGLIK